MRRFLIFAVLASSTILGSHPSQAQQLLESYQAFLSERDHFSSNGQRLTTAAAIIRQDRANYHRFNLRDQGDESDKFFADVDNRTALEKLLERGRAESGVISSIVNGTPLVRVEVWQGNVGPFVVVTLIEPSNIGMGHVAKAADCDNIESIRQFMRENQMLPILIAGRAENDDSNLAGLITLYVKSNGAWVIYLMSDQTNACILAFGNKYRVMNDLKRE